jgi:tripartite-type tricarboxylate transporter receptor subunit TctC
LTRILAFVAAFVLTSSCQRPSSDPLGPAFFSGRTIDYIVATRAGGAYDTYARLIAKHMERRVPGVRIVVRNVQGAAHIIGANEIFAAKPDGLTIGTFTMGLLYSQLVRAQGVRVDLAKLSWIGKAAA